MVLRVRGSTGSLGKLNIARRLWRQLRYQAITQAIPKTIEGHG